eukprot:GSChrysophyteH1.ASY1.ANO1.1091.1 assembled CDS
MSIGSKRMRSLENDDPVSGRPNHDDELYCPYEGCLKVFASRWSLKRHIRTHTGEKPFKCDFCGKEFVQKCSLVRHSQTHMNDRSYTCDFPDCGKTFKLKEYLDVHKRIHRKATERMNMMQCGGVVPSSTSQGSITEQLRERLVRQSIRQREQISILRENENELRRNIADRDAAFKQAMALLISKIGKKNTPTNLLELYHGGTEAATGPSNVQGYSDVNLE